METLSPATKTHSFFKPARRYVYIAALVLSIIRYFLVLFLFPRFNFEYRIFFSTLSFFFIVIVWEGAHSFNYYLNKRLPFEDGVARRFVIQVACSLLVMLPIHTFVIIYFDSYFIPYIDPDFVIVVKVASYFLNTFLITAVNTAYFGLYFFEKWKKNLIEKESWETEKALLQKERLNAQYENLKNQLNPHFLFNSLTSLNSLIHEDQQLASQFLQQLSRVFRYVLENRDKELVTLETELNFIKRYLFLLNTRFENYFSVRLEIDAALQTCRIVPVTLQILVENVIKHNSISEEHPLQVAIYTENGYLVVHNNRNPRNLVETSNRMGLENMKQLYSYLSDKPVEVIQTDEEFTVKVPLL